MVAKTLHEPGTKFFMLTLLSEVPVSARRSEGGHRREFMFACDCGKIVQKPIKDVLTGHHVSCGCHGKRARLEACTSHGMSGTKQYKAWCHMRERCDNPNADFYEDYGGRGVSYDPRWVSFQCFWDDMGETYSDGLEIDRIDPNGDYHKGNCRWATESMQAFNQRRRSTNTTGRTGVYKSATSGSWWAEIRENGANVHLGTFRDFQAACDARADAEKRIYGFTKDA